MIKKRMLKLALLISLSFTLTVQAGMDPHQVETLSKKFEELIQKRPELAGKTLQVEFDWDRDQVNAHYEYRHEKIKLVFWKGFLANPRLTQGAFLATACHELGHVIGGAPKEESQWRPHHTIEGQADYFTTLKCLRWVMKDEELRSLLTGSQDPLVIEKCQSQFKNSYEGENCQKNAQAGLDFVRLFEGSKNPRERANFSTPSPIVAGGTYGIHPNFQCRLDIFFAGALCQESEKLSLSQKNPFVGACQEGLGARPVCWFIKEEYSDYLKP